MRPDFRYQHPLHAPICEASKYPGFFRVTYKGSVRWIQCSDVKGAIEHLLGTETYTVIRLIDGGLCSVDQSADTVMALAFGK